MSLETGSKQYYLGTVSLASALDIARQRSLPPFLPRNIRRVLDSHSRDKRSSKSEDKRRTGISPVEDKMPPRKRQLLLPSKEELTACLQEPVMRIQPIAILPNGSSRPTETARKKALDWLPPPGAQKLQCEIQCKIQRKSGTNSWASVRHENKFATLVCVTQPDGKVAITVDLDAPFVIPLRTLVCPAGEQSNNLAHGSSNAPDLPDCRLRMQIDCNTLAARQDLHSHLFGNDSEAVAFDVQAPLRVFIDSSYFEKHTDQKLVQITSGRINNAQQTAYGLAIDLDWNKNEGTPLEMIAKARRAASGSEAPVKDEVSGTATQDDYEITYLAKGSTGQLRSIVATDLRCQLCKSSLPHTSFDRLRLHYMLHHDHFELVLTEVGNFGGVEQRTLLLQLSEKTRIRASNDVPDDREIEWIRPDRPFDLSRYLNGDRSWTSGAASGRRQRARSPDTNQPARALRPFEPPKDRSPLDAQPLQPRKRKRERVPHIPGIELYRWISKRQIRPGEELCESDDDSEDDWAAQKQRLRAPPIRGESDGEFHNIFDRYVHGEKLCSDKHLQNTVIRFCRHYRKQLIKPLVFKDWKTKLQQLYLTGLISRVVHDYCIKHCTNSDKDVERIDGYTNGHTDGYTNGCTNGETHGYMNGDMEELTNGRLDDDVDMLQIQAHEELVTTQLGRTLAQWQKLPAPDQAIGASRLTGHPKVQQLLGFAAIHPHFQPRLHEMLHSEGARIEAVNKLNSIIHGRSALQVHQDEYEGWLLALTEAKVEVRAGTCICEQTVCDERSLIMCSNPRCRTTGFHMACVNVTEKTSDWKCMACAKRRTPWVLTEADLQERRKQEGSSIPTLQNSHVWLQMLRTEVAVDGDQAGS